MEFLYVTKNIFFFLSALNVHGSFVLCMIDRLENEHLGNVDQYRITREVPLPYAFDSPRDDDNDDADADDQRVKVLKPMGRR